MTLCYSSVFGRMSADGLIQRSLILTLVQVYCRPERCKNTEERAVNISNTSLDSVSARCNIGSLPPSCLFSPPFNRCILTLPQTLHFPSCLPQQVCMSVVVRLCVRWESHNSSSRKEMAQIQPTHDRILYFSFCDYIYIHFIFIAFTFLSQLSSLSKFSPW